MILIDLQQTALAWFMIEQKRKLNPSPISYEEDGFGEEELSDIDRMRNGLLRSLLFIRKNFHEEFGDFVLCCDSSTSWRRDVFPFYKAKRRANREKQTAIDYNTFNANFGTIKKEFAEFLPYKLVEAEGAEGDDIIALLCEWNSVRKVPQPILIHSSDGDFLQLQKYPLVRQWDKFRERWLSCPDPISELRELIIRGDDGDGVPNILSEDNCFVAGVRQRPIFKVKLENWKLMDPENIEEWDDLTRERYARNKKLVDLSMVPQEIKGRIAESFLASQPGSRGKLHNYLAKTSLLSSLGQF